MNLERAVLLTAAALAALAIATGAARVLVDLATILVML